MPTSATADVKRLLELAERIGLPASEAMHQVRELTPDAEVSERPNPAAIDHRPDGS